MNELFAIIASILGLILYWVKGKKGESKELKYARKVVSRTQGNVERARRALQGRKMDELEKILDRQESDIAALRGVLDKGNSPDE